MIVIAGLGNPGKKYENTRHNMGFLTIDRIAEKNDIKVNKIKHRALVGDGFISGHKVLLVKPQTYMNLSGESLREVMNYYNVDIEDLIVIYDDFDIETGSLRIRKKGSAGSHNGMKSVIYQLKNDGFPRVRVGIGKSGSLDWKDFVLGKVGGAESDAISQAISNAADAVECMISEGIDIAMNKYNKKKKKTAEKEAAEERD
ncbi:MAG: aminoacyl-tRNA hydrolase [Clostridiales bacterium]|jgi:PTH1 family peptidyl-tRNA hydrolase|nr:aminoacyl-tRNA hydrolase [Clostridiales bacterium]